MPRLADPADLQARVQVARVARLATLRADGGPRLVPITFALVDGLICSVVDAVKPKSSPHLARLDDVRHDPRVAVLVDRYDEDWAALWWVRVDGRAEVHDSGQVRQRALVALTEKYPAYRARPPNGVVLVVAPTHWTGWTATAR